MHKRLLAVPLLAATAAVLLAGCISLPVPQSTTSPDPSPTESTPLDVAAVEEALFEIMPVLGAEREDFVVLDLRGLADPTFGADWSLVDHDALRVARAVRSFESPGWADGNRGPGFWLDFEVVRMPSAAAADATMTDIASAARDPYTIPADDGSSETEFEARDASGYFPFGTVEQTRRQVWNTGERAVGWVAYFASGPYLAVVVSAAVPHDSDTQGLEDFAAELTPDFVERFQALPADLG